jgi:tungstate transport system ATP-binding protein
MSSHPLLSVRDLKVGYGKRAGGFELRVPHLDLGAGEVLAVLGPNGAGKSTLLLAMAGLLPPREGRVLVKTEQPQALVFQRPVLLRGSVAYNAELPLWARAIPRRTRRERASQALEQFGIGSLARRDAATLSAGELRRLALARAFVVEPAVLLLDEPFDDLDLAGRETLSFDLRRAISETEVAVGMVTHDLRQALLIADRIAVIRGGRLVGIGARDEILRHPPNPTVARLVGMENLILGRVRGRESAGLTLVDLPSGQRLHSVARGSPGDRVWVGIRPEHVKLDAKREEDPKRDSTSASNPASSRGAGSVETYQGTVQRMVSDGTLATAWIDWDGIELRTHLIAGRGLGQSLKSGDAVRFAIPPEEVHLMPWPEAGAENEFDEDSR